MASCAVCKSSVIFGGEKVGGVCYCSGRCASKGQGLGLTPATVAAKTKAQPASTMWVIFWILVAIFASLLNFGLDLAGWSKAGPVPTTALAASAGFALGPFLLASLCMISGQYRSLHGFFKIAGIFALLMVCVGIGTIVPPDGN